jgi:hypothetical protein
VTVNHGIEKLQRLASDHFASDLARDEFDVTSTS